MRIRFLVSISGMDCNWTAGQEVDLPDDQAQHWLRSDIHAEPVETAPDAPAVRKRKS